MQLSVALLGLVAAFSPILQVVQGAPAAALDAATLLQNGQDAQTLNLEFKSLKASDSCENNQTACVTGKLAQCQNGAWKLSACRGSEKCFAIPALTSQGTNLTCTSEATALSLINASGAQGGLTGGNKNSSSSALPNASNSGSLSASGASSTPSASAQEPSGVKVVTLTVTVFTGETPTPAPAAPLAISTLPPQVITLNSAGVASLLSSISANSASVTLNAVTPSSSLSSSSSVVSASASASASAPTIAPAIVATAAASAVPFASLSASGSASAASASVVATPAIQIVGSSLVPFSDLASATPSASVAAATAAATTQPAGGAYGGYYKRVASARRRWRA